MKVLESYPIASLVRLEELGLDKKIWPSCSEMIQRNVTNRGRVTDQRGCKYAADCHWANNTQHMQKRDEKDVHPRPRNVKVRHVKPSPDGIGDIIIDNYCACFRWHQSLKKRHKMNRELAKVIGGEGDAISLRTSKKVVQPDGVVVYEEDYKEQVVPRFPDPTENKELKKELFAAMARTEIVDAEDTAEEISRMGLSRDKPRLDEGRDFVEMTDADAKSIAGLNRS